jgi:hypothetical protein
VGTEAEGDRLLAEIASLRQAVEELRADQRALSAAVEQLTTTFRSLAIHLGIAAEPYKSGREEPRERNLPGFA